MCAQPLTAKTVMPHPQNMNQAAVEHEALRHIIGALRTVLDWKPGADDQSRKLSSLRFICQSFQRHLERLMALKEQDGYMTDAVEQMPSLSEKVQALLHDHDHFEESMHRIVLQLDSISPEDKPKFDKLCRDLEELLIKLEEHHRREADLMQEAYLRDVGGDS
jgi:Hemerythrin HHE cation binding domain